MAEIINLDVVSEAHSEGLTKTAAELRAVRGESDKLGDSFKHTDRDAFDLNEQIEHTRTRVKELREEFSRGGGSGLLGDLKRQESFLRDLEKVAKNMAPKAANVTDNFGSQLGSAFGGVRPMGPLIAVLVGAAAAAAPTIGAMLGGAIAGAAGTGAMAAGIFAASKDQRVRDAASAFGQDISAEFFGAGASFVDPVIKSLDILRKGFADMHVGEQLAKVAPTVEVIAQGFADAGREFMEGFGPALDRMGPLADIAGKGIADFGEALGEALDNITQSKGTVEGLETLLALLTGTVRGLGVALEWLGNGFHRFNRLQAEVFGGLEDAFKAVGLDQFSAGAARLNDIFERMTGTGENMHGVISKLGTEAVNPFTAQLRHAWQEMDQLRGETESTRKGLVDYFTTLRGMDDANLAWEQSLDDLTESVLRNGTSLDIHTQKGRDNIRAVEEGLDAAKRQYEQGQITGAQYDAQIKKLIDIGVKAGMSRKALEELAGKYEIAIFVNTYGNAIMTGMGKALNAAAEHLFGHTAAPTPTNRRESFAEGGTTPAFAPFETHAGEMLWSNREHYVSTAAQTRALMSGASGGSGGPTSVQHTFTFAGNTDSAFATAFMKMLRTGAITISSRAVTNN